MDYFTLTDTEFFQLVTHAEVGDDLEAAYRDFVRATFDLCTGTANRNELLFALNLVEAELQSLYEYSRMGVGKSKESDCHQVFVRKALLFVRRTLAQSQVSVQPVLDRSIQCPTSHKFQWTGSTVELVELVYGLTELKSISNGEIPITELATFFASQFGAEIKDCYSAYVDMKRRKNDSRTYYLDKMRERLNRRMQQDDERDQTRR